MVFDWVFKDSFYWKMVDTIARNTNDPKQIAYIRLALKDMHEAVLYQWKEKAYYK